MMPLVYMAAMRFVSFLSLIFLALLAGGCGGRTVTKGAAQKLLVSFPSGILDKESVKILSVSQISARDAIVETDVRAAFKLERVRGEWVVSEVRIGNEEWAKIDDLAEALTRVRVEQTRRLLHEIADSLGRYRELHGQLPVFHDYTGLSDTLSPRFQSPAVRLDAWRRPFAASRLDETTVRLISGGPDRKMGSADDIVLVRDYSR
ncbi:MAG: hypothetical protein HXY20_06075 [Acidobacteria bacterium]|nr:hypothetical protein [Acidobacteriota bacterium]